MYRTSMASLWALGLALLVNVQPVATSGTQSSQLPNCTGWSNCNASRAVCRFESTPAFFGTTLVADAPKGVSSDGRGPYAAGRDGVKNSILTLGFMSLALGDSSGGQNPRTLTVNMNDAVPSGGGRPLGIITIRGDNQLYTSWERIGKIARSLANIPVGETVSAGQINVSFHFDGRFHVLQMGPQALGHCHADTTKVHGEGTSSGTIHRASATRWIVDLPAGSVGRLFDASHTVKYAIDKGLYRIQLHYELNAIPGAAWVLRSLAESQGGGAVVSRYRTLKRDSSQAYVLDAGQLNSPGFWLLDNNKPQDALLVFQLSVEEYPSSASSHEGLGESYLAVGDTVRSIASYRRSMSLDPKNKAAADALKRLGINP